MASRNGSTLEVAISIAGKVDKSLKQSIGTAQREVSSFSRTMGAIGTAGLAAMGALTTATVNNSPRKILGYRSSEVMFGECLRELGISA